MSSMVVIQAPKCNYVVTEYEWNHYIKNHIPEEILLAGLKRGKGWNRREKELNKIGSGKHKTL